MKKRIILLPLVAILGFVLLSSYNDGPSKTIYYDGTGSSGSVGCSTGSGCHAASPATDVTVSLQVMSGTIPVTAYIPGATYTVKMVATYTGSSSTPVYSLFGFQMSAIKAGSAAVSVGSWASPLPPKTHTWAATSGVNIFEHDTALFVTTGSGGSGSTYEMSGSWTAPAAGTGNVALSSIVNLINGTVISPSVTDKWKTASVTLTEILSPVSAIAGGLTVCAGDTTMLGCTPAGGTWSSSTPAVGTISTSGVVTGLMPGTTSIMYATTSSGIATAVVTVVAAPSAITGTASACIGTSTLLSCATAGGTWSSGDPSIATVGMATGTVTGVSSGIVPISYTNSAGCSSTVMVTINASGAAPIAGTDTVCVGSTIALTNLTPGGTWASSLPSSATISTTGMVTGVAVGTTVISYTATNSCGTATTTKTVTVMPAGSCTSGITPTRHAANPELKLMPNPNHGSFSLQIVSEIKEQATVTIYDLSGKTVKTFVATTNTSIDVDIPHIGGMYFVSVVTQQGNYQTKVVVQ